MALLIFVVVLTILTSATCSLLEATLMSTRIAALEAEKTGKHGPAASRMIGMKKDIAAPTSAILITNTIANTAGATLAGTLAVREFGPGALGIFSVFFTIAILFLAEIVPKTFGAVQWRTLWRLVVWPLAALQTSLRPLVWLTQRTASFLVGGRTSSPTSESEIAAMIRLGGRVGALTSTELELLTSVLRFDDMRASEVTVPRRKVEMIPPHATVRDALAMAEHHPHSRYPLADGELGHAKQVVHLRDLVRAIAEPDREVRELGRSLPHIPTSLPISKLLRQMQRTKLHMVVVVDEFGSAAGIVTLEDVLEELVGQVQDEFDEEVREHEENPAGGWTLAGTTPLRTVEELFELRLEVENVETINGWLVSRLGKLPTKGDTVHDESGLVLEVVELQGDSASRIHLRMADPPDEDDEADKADKADDAQAPGDTSPSQAG